jgi:hypothetical protein
MSSVPWDQYFLALRQGRPCLGHGIHGKARVCPNQRRFVNAVLRSDVFALFDCRRPEPIFRGDDHVLPATRKYDLGRQGIRDPAVRGPDLGDAEASRRGQLLEVADATSFSLSRFSFLHSITNSRHSSRIAPGLSFLKSAMVLKSGANRPVSHISSMLR